MPNLHIDVKDGLGIALEDVIGVSAAILGITGSGKTNTAAVVFLANEFPSLDTMKIREELLVRLAMGQFGK